MPIIERDLDQFELKGSTLNLGSSTSEFVLVSSRRSRFKGFTWCLSFPLDTAYRISVVGPDRPAPPHDNIILPNCQRAFNVLSIDKHACTATISLPESAAVDHKVELRLNWKKQISVEVWDTDKDELVHGDLAARAMGLTEKGVIRHYRFDRSRLHLGLGEKAAPIDLTGRSFDMHATDAAWYDAYRTDPLYKHTPFLISKPRAVEGAKAGITFAIYQASNSRSVWDIGRQTDYPSGGRSMSYTQDWGGLEEWVMLGKGVGDIVQTFGEMVGKPMLVGRDWLGYLASTMLLADEENAQELLSQWPEECQKHDIPCSAMHLSSGFTVDEKSGERWVFHMNKKRYPDFQGMVQIYHRAGMRVVPNVKPYMLQTHPAYQRLMKSKGLYIDPITNGPATQNLWSTSEGTSADGSWVDLSAEETRKWWSEGIQGLIDLGVDGVWDDNSEFFTRDDEILFRNQFAYERKVPCEAPATAGLMGRLTGTEMMNKVSHDTLVKSQPDRRPFVLTRSGNVGTFKYACSTWSGDNETNWETLRGSQHIQHNAALSLMQSYGSDVGGFCGDLPSAELFVRWVQLGVTHSRFSIHSNTTTISGEPKLTLPWTFPEVLPAVREAIKWRYEMLPYLYNLMWESHAKSAPANAPLFYGPFANDTLLYTPQILEGFDSWLGVGTLLVAPALYRGMLSREVYFPKTSPSDMSTYFDLHAPFGRHQAGTRVTVSTPIDHHGLFARQGAIIPIGKPQVTVTAVTGIARTYADGVESRLESEGGRVALDDWRGVLIFPGETDDGASGTWTEDDGVSKNPDTLVIKLEYSSTISLISVKATAAQSSFKPLWDRIIHVILPMGDQRPVESDGKNAGASLWKGRTAWKVRVA